MSERHKAWNAHGALRYLHVYCQHSYLLSILLISSCVESQGGPRPYDVEATPADAERHSADQSVQPVSHQQAPSEPDPKAKSCDDLDEQWLLAHMQILTTDASSACATLEKEAAWGKHTTASLHTPPRLQQQYFEEGSGSFWTPDDIMFGDYTLGYMALRNGRRRLSFHVETEASHETKVVAMGPPGLARRISKSVAALTEVRRRHAVCVNDAITSAWQSDSTLTEGTAVVAVASHIYIAVKGLFVAAAWPLEILLCQAESDAKVEHDFRQGSAAALFERLLGPRVSTLNPNIVRAEPTSDRILIANRGLYRNCGLRRTTELLMRFGLYQTSATLAERMMTLAHLEEQQEELGVIVLQKKSAPL